MSKDEQGALWHLEADFGTSRVLVGMAERDGRFGIRVRLDADGAETAVFSLTPEQAGWLGEALPGALAMLRSWQEQQDWELSLHDPFAGLDSADRGDGHEMDATASPVPADRAPSAATAEDVRIPPRRGQAWSSAEEARLVEAHRAGQGVEHLAAELQRSPRAIRKRLEKLEMVAVDR